MAPNMIVACEPSGSGASSFLRSAAIELARLAPPDGLRLAGIDPGGRELAVLEALPHMHLELATSLRHAGPLMDWLSEEAAWRRAHDVASPAMVLLMVMRREGMPADCRSAWRRLRELMAGGPSAGIHAILAWEGAPHGPGWEVRFGAGTSMGLATPEAPGRPALTWLITAGGRPARVRVPWLAAQDLDAAVKDMRRASSFDGWYAPLLDVGFARGSPE
jgi:hypothetical protein